MARNLCGKERRQDRTTFRKNTFISLSQLIKNIDQILIFFTKLYGTVTPGNEAR